MPNQLDYSTELLNIAPQRPSRVTDSDSQRITVNQKQVLFGTQLADILEIWVYNSDDTFAGHINIVPTDTSLSLTSVIDNTGAYEMLNLDLQNILNRMTIPPGRYALVINTFRNEVGSEDSYQLTIVDISQDRTEIRIQPTTITNTALKDIYEFIVPSVPRLFAQALTAQIFGQSQNATPDNSTTPTLIRSEMDGIVVDTSDRITLAGADDAFDIFFNSVKIQIYNLALFNMATDAANFNVQQVELEGYISAATIQILSSIASAGSLDPRFTLQ